MSNESGSPFGTSGQGSQTGASSVGQTANVGRSTSITTGAAKVFKEFKWGLLTLFLLMVVVIGLVYDGGRKKKAAEADKLAKPTDATAQVNESGNPESGQPPSAVPSSSAPLVANPTSPSSSNAAPGDQQTGAPVVEAYQPTTGVAPSLPQVSSQDKQQTAVKPANPTTTEQTYTVKPGDTLTKIANLMSPGKGNIKALLDANKSVLANANRLRPGMTLKIPAIAAAPAAKEAPTPIVAENKTNTGLTTKKEAAAKSEPGEYTVQSGDTLEHIARRLFNDGNKWRDLYEWNREQLADPSHLRAGQVLKVKQTKTAATPAAPAPGAAHAETQAPATSTEKHSAGTAAHPVVATAVVAQKDGTAKTSEPEVLNRSTSASQLP